MEKKDFDEIKNLFSNVSKTKAVKDVKTSILMDMSGDVDSDPMKELFKKTRQLGKIRSKLIKNRKKKDENNGKDIIFRIDLFLGSPIKSANPTFSDDRSHYTFADGAEADDATYNVYLENFNRNVLTSRILAIEVLISDALSELYEQEKDFWYKNDGIEEIDYTEEKTDGKQ